MLLDGHGNMMINGWSHLVAHMRSYTASEILLSDRYLTCWCSLSHTATDFGCTDPVPLNPEHPNPETPRGRVIGGSLWCRASDPAAIFTADQDAYSEVSRLLSTPSSWERIREGEGGATELLLLGSDPADRTRRLDTIMGGFRGAR